MRGIPGCAYTPTGGGLSTYTPSAVASSGSMSHMLPCNPRGRGGDLSLSLDLDLDLSLSVVLVCVCGVCVRVVWGVVWCVVWFFRTTSLTARDECRLMSGCQPHES